MPVLSDKNYTQFIKHLLNMSTMGSLGALAGAVFALPTLRKIKDEELQPLLEENVVDSKKTIKSIIPEAEVATSMQELKNIMKDIPAIGRGMIKTIYKTDEDIAANPSYYKDDKPIFILPPKVNKHALGHEIGHHMDFEHRPYGVSDAFRRFVLFDLLGPERRAWRQSPFKYEPGGEKLKETALKTYDIQQSALRSGTFGGMGLYLAYQALKPLFIRI